MGPFVSGPWAGCTARQGRRECMGSGVSWPHYFLIFFVFVKEKLFWPHLIINFDPIKLFWLQCKLILAAPLLLALVPKPALSMAIPTSEWDAAFLADHVLDLFACGCVVLPARRWLGDPKVHSTLVIYMGSTLLLKFLQWYFSSKLIRNKHWLKKIVEQKDQLKYENCSCAYIERLEIRLLI